MSPEEFFGERWRGQGEVRGPFGQVLRRFEVVYDGKLSDEHRAYHVDETVRYTTGEVMERRWALHADGEGVLIGFDAMQASRIRVRPRPDGFRVRFDRPSGVVRSPAPRSVVLDFTVIGPGQLTADGWARWMGLPVARTRASFTRINDEEPL